MPGPGCTCGVCKTCYQRAWRAKNPDKVKASKDKWARTRNRTGDPKAREYNKVYDAAHPVRNEKDPRKRSARNAVVTALRHGHLVKGACEVCGAEENVQAHHDDYDKPLDVRWLCPRHHSLLHKRGDQGG